MEMDRRESAAGLWQKREVGGVRSFVFGIITMSMNAAVFSEDWMMYDELSHNASNTNSTFLMNLLPDDLCTDHRWLIITWV